MFRFIKRYLRPSSRGAATSRCLTYSRYGTIQARGLLLTQGTPANSEGRALASLIFTPPEHELMPASSPDCAAARLVRAADLAGKG
jgi:hypothetical protein